MYLKSTLVICILHFWTVVFAARAGTSVPVPRSKTAKGAAISKTFGQGFFSRVIREIKGNFCSELESLTLQLTRPVDAPLPATPLEDLINCVNSEYENPVFTVSLMSKISRKLFEPNIYTKLKSLIIIHKLIEHSDHGARNAIMECINSLQKEQDPKTGQLYFSFETIEKMGKAASNVQELEAVEFAKGYASYVFDFVALRGDKTPLIQKPEENADRILQLVELGESLEDKCKTSTGQSLSPGSKMSSNFKITHECLDRIKDDRTWALKQLQKLSELELNDAELLTDILNTLSKYNIKSKSKSTSSKATTATTTTSAATTTVSENGTNESPTGSITKTSSSNSDKSSISISSSSSSPLTKEKAIDSATSATSTTASSVKKPPTKFNNRFSSSSSSASPADTATNKPTITKPVKATTTTTKSKSEGISKSAGLSSSQTKPKVSASTTSSSSSKKKQSSKSKSK